LDKMAAAVNELIPLPTMTVSKELM